MIELLLAPVLLVTSAGPIPTSAYMPTAADLEVEQSAREFRIQVYETFRSERPEYDRRRSAGNLVIRVYRESEKSVSQREAVIDWFAAAQTAAAPGQVGPLPEFPEFVKKSDDYVAINVPPSSSPAAASPRRNSPPANSSATTDLNRTPPRSAPRSNSLLSRLRAAVAEGALTTPDSATESGPQPMEDVPSRSVPDSDSPPAVVPAPATELAQVETAKVSPPEIELGQAVEPRTADRPAPPVVTPVEEVNQRAVPAPETNPAVMHESTPAPIDHARLDETAADEQLANDDREAVEPARTNHTMTVPETPRLPDAAPIRPADRSIEQPSPIADPPQVIETQDREPEPAAPAVPAKMESDAREEASLAELPPATETPVEQTPAAKPATEETAVAMPATEETTVAIPATEETEVAVGLADDVAPAPVESAPPVAPADTAPDLGAIVATDTQFQALKNRASEYNDSLRQLEDELSDTSPPRVFDIARWLNDLAELAAQRRQLAADFADVLVPDVQENTEFLSIETATTRLTEKIEAARFRLRASRSAGGEEERQQALGLLDVLARQLDQLRASP